MDKFSEKISEAIDIAIKSFLFEPLNADIFGPIENAIQTEVEKALGHSVIIRWTDHSIKLNKNTFCSTFTIKDDNGNVRKYTVSPESTLKFPDLVNPDNDVTDKVKKF